MILAGKSKIKKTGRSVTLFAINVTWTGPGSNPIFRGKKMAANHLTHDVALEGASSSDCHFKIQILPYRQYKTSWHQLVSGNILCLFWDSCIRCEHKVKVAHSFPFVLWRVSEPHSTSVVSKLLQVIRLLIGTNRFVKNQQSQLTTAST